MIGENTEQTQGLLDSRSCFACHPLARPHSDTEGAFPSDGQIISWSDTYFPHGKIQSHQGHSQHEKTGPKHGFGVSYTTFSAKCSLFPFLISR